VRRIAVLTEHVVGGPIRAATECALPIHAVLVYTRGPRLGG
jgi:hypothetical protein